MVCARDFSSSALAGATTSDSAISDALLQECLGQPRIPAGRDPEIPLPAAQGTGIDAKQPGKRFLQKARSEPISLQPVTDGYVCRGRVEADEVENARKEMQSRSGPIQLPVRDGGGSYADAICHVALTQALVRPPFTQTISGRFEASGVGGREGPLARQVGMAKRQLGDAGRESRAA